MIYGNKFLGRTNMPNDGVGLVEQTKKYIATMFQGNSDGHDYDHMIRVYNNAMEIYKIEKTGDILVIQLAALLHDVDDHKLFNTTNYENARKFLMSNNVPEETIERVVDVIGSVSFSKNGLQRPATIEGCIVQDADRLDAIGAIGIARAFAFGGSHGNTLLDTVDHFEKKLLLLRNGMNTKGGKVIANKRHSIMVAFLRELSADMDIG